MDIQNLRIKDIHALYEQKELSSKELVSMYLDRIESENPSLNAMLSVSKDALEEAEGIDEAIAAGDEMGPLTGIPVVLKDNILVKGWEATAGSRILEGHIASYSATVVERLRSAGAILVGRANMDDAAMGSSGETSHFGATKNPWDTSKIPGGSSSGPASAVAAGFSPVALGSDTGGSVRLPAALCGVVGLKPTYGRVSRYGLIAMASSLDQIGPMARTVLDAARVLQAIEGKDAKDATSLGDLDTTVPEILETGVKGMRIGLPKEYFIDGMDERVKESVLSAARVLESGGAEIIDVSLPNTEYALAAYYIIMPAEASSNLGRYDGIRYGFSSSGKDLIDSYEQTRGAGFGREVQRRIMLGSFVLSAGYYDAYYRKALQARTLIKQDFDNVFKEVDLVLGPTSPALAWPIGEKFDDPLAMYLADIYTISANLATIPAMSIPCGFSDGLPIGFQLMAKPFNEHAMFRAGAYYQSVTDWHQRTPV